MEPARRSPLRIYREAASDDPHGGHGDDLAGIDAHLMATQELLRARTARATHRDIEPFSRAWFEELELKRYAAHGAWLRRVLEFSRHSGETMLMLGPGVGSDAVQYHRHGVQITVCSTPSDKPELVRRNFELRGHNIRIVHAGADLTTPFDRWAFDLAYLNAFHTPPQNIHRAVAELYRVLKPGGKVFVLVPAYYDTALWQRVLIPFHNLYRRVPVLTDAPQYSASSLKQLFGPFGEHRVVKRHLRRSELPYIWRFMPLGILERLLGRVLVLRAFKPVTAALDAAEPAA